MISGKRATLLAAGVSVIAIGSAMPSYGQNYGGSLDYHVSQNVNSLLTIDLVDVIDGGDVDAPLVLDSYANAYVAGGTSGTTSNFGAIVQYARAVEPVDGDATIAILNNGIAAVYATAIATGSSATTTEAYAQIVDGINQYAEAPDNVSVGLTNNGLIDISALAIANASSTFGAADASIGNGIVQAGEGENEAMSLVNTGTIDINATAVVGPVTTGYAQFYASQADASASIGNGISQSASGNVASTALTNSGTIHVNAFASASASASSVDATVDNGIVQSASSFVEGGTASASLTNSLTGVIDVSAIGSASASGYANVAAGITNGVNQYASGETASVTLDNAGGISVAATANADASSESGTAYAAANVDNGVYQNAYGGAITVDLANSGTISVDAVANASASNAYADAGIGYGVNQIGVESTTSSVSLTNSSPDSIDVSAIASAYGSNFGSASAVINGGVNQVGSGATSAAVDLGNTGSINVDVAAFASGSDAVAQGHITNGISQNASSGGAATADLTNSSTINVSAGAIADAGFGISDVGDATVTIGNGLIQIVGGGALASADLANTGAVIIDATATASANDAGANANINTGITQVASIETGAATVSLTNSTLVDSPPASIQISSVANAYGDDIADATAGINVGLNQVASGGTASALIDSSGEIGIAASASASAYDAGANASINNGVNQVAAGAVSTADLTNSGTLDILANASVSAFVGTAVAGINNGVNQVASGSTSSLAGLTNDGSIHVGASAFASAYDGDAVANIGNGVNQIAAGGTTATADLANTGSIVIDAFASSSSFGALADGNLNSGIGQIATAGVEGGIAAASLLNDVDASIDISNVANAYGSAYGHASAYITYGINQIASGETAFATVDNSGAINVSAAASASGFGGIGGAFLNTGINQSVSGADAMADLTNSGSIDLGADAFASAYSGYAVAAVNNGIAQIVSGADAAASIDNTGSINVTAQGTADVDFGYGVADIGNGIVQTANGNTAIVDLTNDDTIDVLASAFAGATSSEDVSFSAYAVGDIGNGINQSSFGNLLASSTIGNTGSISVAADATADAIRARADANVDIGIYQRANTESGSGATVVSLTNALSDSIDVSASANAYGSDYAFASGYVGTGIYQSAGGGDASASLVNHGSINVDALAYGSASDVLANAVIGNGISQNASGLTAAAELTNSSLIDIAANASGFASTGYVAAGVGNGVRQSANGTDSGTATLNNTGTIAVDATATSTADRASADANVGVGIYQYASSSAELGTATVSLTNTSINSIDVAASAVASGTAYGDASAYANGIYQQANGPIASVTTNNTGAINVSASAIANADLANAFAVVGYGLSQNATGTSAAVTFSNTRIFNVDANAQASGSSAGAVALAQGVSQWTLGDDVLASFSNSSTGSFTVDAVATAIGTVGSSANASATGLIISGDPIVLAVSNDKTFAVNASATAELASANALGMGVYATEGTFTGYATWTGLNTIGGSITNTGNLTVLASALGATATTTTGFTPFAITGANATGIEMVSAVNTATITNSGTIDVQAVATGGVANATGIAVRDYTGSPVVPLEGDTFTLLNQGGTIIARQSVDGGVTFTRGMAIDTSDAPNAAAINLKATATRNGFIYGNIDVSADDAITVSNGETKFDGVVNPEGELEGSLTIASGGTLYFVSQPHATVSYTGGGNFNSWNDGPAAANVDSFVVESNGKLAIQMPLITGGSGPLLSPAALSLNLGSYPVITADTAVLGAGSILEVRPSSWNGLYGNSYALDNIIDANSLTGTFGSVVTHTGTPLLSLAASYDTENNVDLTVTRVAFGAVNGLTSNQSAVGDGIESVYSTDLTGDFAKLLGALFTQNTATYQDSLNQLSGSEYAGYLQSLTGLTGRFTNLISSVTDCPAANLDATLACRREDGGRIWGQINYGQVKKDGDALGSSYKADQYYIALGADYATSADLVLGVSGAYVKNDLDFKRYNNRIKSDGYQLGVYAVYDPGTFYAKAIGSYTNLNGDAHRNIRIASAETVPANGVGLAATPAQANVISGVASGKPDATAFAAYGEIGYRIDMGSSTITPYAGLEYASTKLKSFTETGVAAANLHVSGGKQDRAASQLGIKWGGQMGSITPEIKLGWRHQFGETNAAVDAEFDIAPGSNFRVLSQSEKRDAALVDIGLSADIGKNIVGKIGYQGRLNGDADSHAGGITLIARFGGAAK